MRLSEPVSFTKIDQAMIKGVCPFCTYLKNFQTVLLKESSPEAVAGLCNFHSWALAAAVSKDTVAQVFIGLLRRYEARTLKPCTVCDSIREEEQIRMKEFAAELSRTRVKEWVEAHGTLCIPHGTKLLSMSTPEVQSVVQRTIRRTAAELQEGLDQLLSTSGDTHQGPGILGRAAEFLNAQRGLSV